MLQPLIHVGYKYVFLTLGPKVGIGKGVIGGFTAGIVLRF